MAPKPPKKLGDDPSAGPWAGMEEGVPAGAPGTLPPLNVPPPTPLPNASPRVGSVDVVSSSASLMLARVAMPKSDETCVPAGMPGGAFVAGEASVKSIGKKGDPPSSMVLEFL